MNSITFKSINELYSETITPNREGGLLNYDIDGVSISSVDYFAVEGRIGNVTLIGDTIPSELFNIIVNNDTDTGNNIENSLAGTINLYLDITVDIHNEFYGVIPKASIEYDYKTKIIKFKVHDLLTVQSNVKRLFDMNEIDNMSIYNMLTTLMNKFNERTELPELTVLNQYNSDESVYIENAVLSQSKGLHYNDTDIVHNTDSRKLRFDYYTTMTDIINHSYVNIITKTLYVDLQYEIISNTLNVKPIMYYKYYNTKWQNLTERYEPYSSYSDILKFDLVEMNDTGTIVYYELDSSALGTDSVYTVYNLGDFGNENFTDMINTVESLFTDIYTYYVDTYLVDNGEYLNTTNSIASTIDNCTYEITPSEPTMLFGTGDFKTNNAWPIIPDEIEYIEFHKPLVELLHITNSTIYQDYKNLILRNKFTNNFGTSSFTLIDGYIIEHNKSNTTYSMPDNDIKYFTSDTTMLDTYYNYLLRYITDKHEFILFKNSLPNSINLCDTITYAGNNFFIIELDYDKENEQTKIVCLKES